MTEVPYAGRGAMHSSQKSHVWYEFQVKETDLTPNFSTKSAGLTLMNIAFNKRKESKIWVFQREWSVLLVLERNASRIEYGREFFFGDHLVLELPLH